MRKKCVMRKRTFAAALAGMMMFAGIGVSEPMQVKAGDQTVSETREMPVNPVHHCTKENDGTDKTDWSYVYFGSYPQSEVTGSALTAAILGASYDANGDAWVNGTKYRRLSKDDTNSDSNFGDSEYRYFKWERIKWRVLRVNSSTMFVLADKGLDSKKYHDPGDSITWENCTLRNWLNNDFYRTAFSSSEQGAIVSQTVVNEDNLEWDIEGGNDTTDKVYLLSRSEVMNPDYGFCEDDSVYSVSRRVKGSDYVEARGASILIYDDYVGNCGWWWLRSPGCDTDLAADVEGEGYLDRYGVLTNDSLGTCLPALHISLSSDLWSMVDDGYPAGSGTENAGVSAVAPKESSLKGKIKAKSKSFTVKWKKQTDVSGYQIQYSTNKKFKKGTKIKTVKKPNVTKLTVKKLKAGKKYYVRVRTYKTVNGTNYYSPWSKSKSVKIN